jgi:type IV pilus assembly protein PilB
MSLHPVSLPPLAPSRVESALPPPRAEPTPAGTPVALPDAVLVQTLLTTPLFAGCAPVDLADALSGIKAYECPPTAVLMTAGDPGGAVGLLISGTARVSMGPPGDAAAAHDTLSAPDVFGEVAVLAGGTQPYSVLASSPCRVLWISKRATGLLYARLPTFGKLLGQRLAARFRALSQLMPLLTPMPGEDDWADVSPATIVPALVPVAAEPTVPAAPPLSQPPALPFVELSEYDLQPSVLNMIPARLIRQHRLLPVKLVKQQLTLAMVAPKNQPALVEIGRLLQAVTLEIVAISQDDFNSALIRLKLDDPRNARPEKGDRRTNHVNPDTVVLEGADIERDAPAPPKTVGEDVLRLVNRIFATALEREASDIHLEPVSGGLKVRFRVSGVLEDWPEAVPPTHARGVIARLKVVGGVDITERRRPQDGRLSVKAGKREVDIRLSTMPSSRGEKLVMLDSSAGSRPLTQLFLEPRVLAMARKALNRPFGGLVIAGATGSGKTSTMYSMLHERRQTRPETHVVMVEDPIEFRLEGPTQVQVDHGAGLEFATVLRSTLRQDPDVIVVGEMRDTETARIGLEAAMTGHLLLTSVHANGAVATVQRLEQLGCGRPLIAQSVALVLVQRLVRRLCSACRTTQEVPKVLVDSLIARRILPAGSTKTALPHAPGCDACQRTGFVGRVAVMEAMHFTDEVQHMIAGGDDHTEIQKFAVQTGALIGFSAYAGYLMEQGLIGPGEALLAVAAE